MLQDLCASRLYNSSFVLSLFMPTISSTYLRARSRIQYTMSLYVGHLPPHVRPEELERVFRRFGRCNLQMKDGYGFVIYEVTANAEKALRALRGEIICGEQLSLNWSNRQPRPFQRSARGGGRFYEPYRERNFREEDNGFGFRGSQDRRDFAGTSRAPVHNRGGHHLDDVFDKETGHVSEEVDDVGRVKGVGVKERVFKERVVVEGVASDPNPEENDRWGEPASDAFTGREQEDNSDFDRYEPYQGYSRRDEKESNRRGSSYGSRERGSSLERGYREHSFDETERNVGRPKPHVTCYNCGLAGHIVRNCPHGDARRERFIKFTHRRDGINFRDEGEDRAKRLRPNSWGRPNSSRDPLLSRRPRWDRKEAHSEKARRVGRSETFPESSKKNRSNSRADSRGKKKRKAKNISQKKSLKKRKARRSGTSSPSSDSSTTKSQSHSKSMGSSSATSSHSRSRSVSRSRSASSSSRSSSTSSYSKSRSSRSRSKSRLRSRSSSSSSFLRSQSLSVSLDRNSPPRPQDVDANVPMSMSPKASLDNLDKVPMGNENGSTRFKADGDDASYSTSKVGHMENNAFLDTHVDIDVNSEDQGVKTELQLDAGAKLNTQVLSRISTQEMMLALKHYGLSTPEGGESGVSVETYFGAARMWPWEMVYYRRLKKGPISTENYARRLEQNREFGIVDKYIRSSSGWGEFHHNDT